MLSDPYVGKRPTLDNPEHDVDVDSPTTLTTPGGSSLLKSLIEFYLDKHSTVDLGFNDSLVHAIPKRLFIPVCFMETIMYHYRSKAILLLYMESGLC